MAETCADVNRMLLPTQFAAELTGPFPILFAGDKSMPGASLRDPARRSCRPQ